MHPVIISATRECPEVVPMRCEIFSCAFTAGDLTDFEGTHRLVRPGSRVPMFTSSHGQPAVSTPPRSVRQRSGLGIGDATFVLYDIVRVHLITTHESIPTPC